MTLLPSVARGHRAVKLQPYLHKLIDALFPDWDSLTTNLETCKINELIRLVLMPWWYVCIMRSLSTQGLHKDPKRSKATIKLCINRTCRGSLQVAGHIQVALNVHGHRGSSSGSTRSRAAEHQHWHERRQASSSGMGRDPPAAGEKQGRSTGRRATVAWVEIHRRQGEAVEKHGQTSSNNMGRDPPATGEKHG